MDPGQRSVGQGKAELCCMVRAALAFWKAPVEEYRGMGAMSLRACTPEQRMSLANVSTYSSKQHLAHFPSK